MLLKQKYQSMSLPVKASIWFVICGVLKDVIDVLVTPIFTRILTTEQYGIFNVYNSWFQIIKIIFTLYIFSDIFNVGLVKFEADRDRFVSTTLGFVTASVGFYLVLYLLLHNWIDKIVGMPRYLILLLFVHVIMHVPYYCWIRRERYDYHYKNVVIVSFLYILLQPVTALVAILYLNIPLNPGSTRVIAAVGIQIAIGSVLYIGIMLRGKSFYDKYYWRYSLKTGVQLVPFNLSKVVLSQSDRIMLNYYSGSADTGIYSVAHSAAFVLQAVTEAINGAFVPWLYRRLKVKEWHGIKNVINGILLLVAVCVFGIDIIAPEIMKLLGSGEYYEGVRCIPALSYSVFLIFLYTIFTNIELFYGKNIYVTHISIVGMVLNIILNAIFIPSHGFVAAGYTTLAGYFVICIGHFVLLVKCLQSLYIKVDDLLNTWVIFAVSILLFGFTLVCDVLYRWNIVRWIAAAILVGSIVFTKNKWIGLISDLKKDQKVR